MPVVTTNNQELHIEIKKLVAGTPGRTIGKTVDKLFEFELKTNYLSLPEEEAQKVIEFVKKLYNEQKDTPMVTS